MDTMYPGKVNSPATALNGGINDSVTTITVVDASRLASAPNLAVIGTGEDAETILYTGISSNDLTGCTREFQGAAKAWDSGTSVARFFTAYDYDTLRTNLGTHDPATTGVHGVGAGTILATPLTADLDFAKYKAIALVCDNGATVPASPTKGQWFLHTPTGRNVLMQYNGSAWQEIISFGTMDMYVDKTDGSDAVDKGGAVDSGAFATWQYAINRIPGDYGGNVTIYSNDEDYDEILTIRGKNPTGAYTIGLVGQLALQETVVSATVAAGSGGTQGTVTKAGAFTGDSYANLLCYFVTDDAYRIIDSHTDDVLTLVGTAPSSTAQDVKIYDWGTILNKVSVSGGQKGVYIYDIKLDTTSGLSASGGAEVTAYRCDMTVTGGSAVRAYDFSALSTHYCYLTSNTTAPVDTWGHSSINLNYTKVYLSSDTAMATRAFGIAFIYFRYGSILDASAKTSNKGLYLTSNSNGNCWSSAAAGYSRIRNFNKGVYADLLSSVINTANVQYSGNDTNEDNNTGSDAHGYID